MGKFKTLPIEKMIVEHLKFELINSKIKVDDILEWSTSEATIDKNIREDEIKLYLCGVYVAVSKTLDKRIK